MDLEIAHLDRSEIVAASTLLGRAFLENPLNLAITRQLAPRARLRSNAAGARCQLGVAREHGLVLVARLPGEVFGVLVAAPPLGHPFPLPSLGERLRVLLVQGPRVARDWAGVAETLGRRHPQNPHWYLSILGVDPRRTRSRVGSLLLRRFLSIADEDPAPCYLETDREENLGFYQRGGFQVVGELRVLGVPVWRMQRGP